jgi:hypothetical protein
MSSHMFSVVVIAVSAFAVWHRSTIGWIVAGLANAAAAWLLWTGI